MFYIQSHYRILYIYYQYTQYIRKYIYVKLNKRSHTTKKAKNSKKKKKKKRTRNIITVELNNCYQIKKKKEKTLYNFFPTSLKKISKICGAICEYFIITLYCLYIFLLYTLFF